MALRKFARDWAGGRLSRSMAKLNARHPWSHNDHFHSWILANLPEQRRTALDVGCGRGDLLAALSPHFVEVRGTDVDDVMRQRAADRCAGLPNVSVTDDQLSDVRGELDLVTMVAGLHHLDVTDALLAVRRLLAPGGRFLAVGLAPPRSLRGSCVGPRVDGDESANRLREASMAESWRWTAAGLPRPRADDAVRRTSRPCL